jgi:hypothetical protein
VRQDAHSWAVATVFVVSVAIAGCSDDGQGRTTPKRAPDEARETPNHTERRQDETRGTARPGKLSRERKQKTKSGAVVVLPPRPTDSATEPERGCHAKTFRGARQTIRRFLPPAPGLTARRADSGHVVVSYSFAPFESRCRPASLELVVDDNDDPLPPTGTTERVHDRRGEVRVSLPDRMRDADVVRAIARTEEGLPGNAVAVRIE